MNRRELLKALGLALPAFAGCGYLRVDPWNVLIRSDVIDSLEEEREILSRARLDWTEDGMIRVLYVSGTAYERGYQHGALLRREVQDNLNYFYERAKDKFHFEELFVEAYERMRPFLTTEYLDEMRGLAHGAKLPLNMIHYIHALPEIGEWGGKQRLRSIVKSMADGTFGTSCSNLAVNRSKTVDGKMYTVRILDWGLHRISKLHQYPLIVVGRPNSGFAYANIGWVGFLGAISGMNERGITLGEMGYGSPPNETLSGQPMPFLLRDVMLHSDSLADVRRILSGAVGTNSFVFLMSDGKRGEAEMYIKDRDRFVVFKPGQDLKDGAEALPGIPDTVYGGHFRAAMCDTLQQAQGTINPQMLMQDIIPKLALKSNFQNVIYAPESLEFWVNNAHSADERAAEQPYTYFNLRTALNNFPGPDSK